MEGQGSAPTAQEQKSTVTPEAMPGATPRAMGGTEDGWPWPGESRGSHSLCSCRGTPYGGI